MDHFDSRAIQTRVADWVRSRLGIAAMDSRERGRRVLEEAMELAQSVGVTDWEADTIRQHVFSKEPGVTYQEIGGVALTLLGCAEAMHYPMSACAIDELERIENLPPEKFRKRQELNASIGIGAPPDPPTNR